MLSNLICYHAFAHTLLLSRISFNTVTETIKCISLYFIKFKHVCFSYQIVNVLIACTVKYIVFVKKYEFSTFYYS